VDDEPEVEFHKEHVALGCQAYFVERSMNPMTHAHDTGVESQRVSHLFQPLRPFKDCLASFERCPLRPPIIYPTPEALCHSFIDNNLFLTIEAGRS